MPATVSPASYMQMPPLIPPSLAAAVSVIVAMHIMTSSIQRADCSSSSSPGGTSAAQRNSSAYHRQAAPAASSSSRDLPHPMRLRRAPTTTKGGDGEGGGGGNRRFACYSCRYVAESSGFTIGSPDCNDPFVPLQIPEVMCGASCYKMVRRSSDGGLSVARGCERGCEDREDDAGFNRCCRSKFCNRSTSLGHVTTTATVVCSALLSRLLVSRLSSASS